MGFAQQRRAIVARHEPGVDARKLPELFNAGAARLSGRTQGFGDQLQAGLRAFEQDVFLARKIIIECCLADIQNRSQIVKRCFLISLGRKLVRSDIKTRHELKFMLLRLILGSSVPLNFCRYLYGIIEIPPARCG